MFQDLCDYSRVFDAGHNLDMATATFTLLDINIENTLEPLHPGHRIAALLNGFFLCANHFRRLSDLTPFPQRDQGAMLAVRREKSVKSCQIHPWLRNQRGQPCDEIQRLKKHMSGAVAVRSFEFIANLATIGKRQPLFRYRRPGNVAAQPLAQFFLMAVGHDTGVEGKAGLFGYPRSEEH